MRVGDQRCSKPDLGRGERGRLGDGGEIGNGVVGRIEAVGIDLTEIGHRRLGALIDLAVRYPERRIIARRIEGIDRGAVLLAADDAVELAVGKSAQLFRDRGIEIGNGGRRRLARDCRGRGRLARRCRGRRDGRGGWNRVFPIGSGGLLISRRSSDSRRSFGLRACVVRFRSRRRRCHGSSRALRLTPRLLRTGCRRLSDSLNLGRADRISRIWRRSRSGGPFGGRRFLRASRLYRHRVAQHGITSHRRRRIGDRRGFVGRRLGCLGERARCAGEQHDQGSRGEKPGETNTPHCKISVGALAASAELLGKR